MKTRPRMAASEQLESKEANEEEASNGGSNVMYVISSYMPTEENQVSLNTLRIHKKYTIEPQQLSCIYIAISLYMFNFSAFS